MALLAPQRLDGISSTQTTPAASTSSAGRMLAVISSTRPRTCTTGGPPMPNSRLAAIGRTSCAPPRSFGFSLLRRHLRAQPRNGAEHAHLATLARDRVRRRLAHRHRRPEQGVAIGERESGTRDPDNDERPAVDADAAADAAGSAPKRSRQPRSLRMRKPSARRGLRLPEKNGRAPASRRSAGTGSERVDGVRRPLPSVVRQVAEDRHPQRRHRAWMFFGQPDQPVGTRIRQRSQQHAVDAEKRPRRSHRCPARA